MLILAPMYDVTDTVFRQIVASCAPPDMFFTEFVNVDGLQSPGRARLLHFLKKESGSTPIVAQIWGKQPDNYFKTAQEIAQAGFSGIDINLGCPDKTVLKNGCCSAMILPENRALCAQIIQATKQGAGDLPVSVKTRLGFDQTDFSWHRFLLEQEVAMLSIHGRTTREMSKVPARWQEIAEIRKLRDELGLTTKIIGNGDVINRQQAEQKMRRYSLDGIMLGRAIFSDPYLFAKQSSWSKFKPEAKIKLYLKHLELYQQTYTNNERRFNPLKKFMKVYLSGFEGAAELRLKIAQTTNVKQATQVLTDRLT